MKFSRSGVPPAILYSVFPSSTVLSDFVPQTRAIIGAFADIRSTLPRDRSSTRDIQVNSGVAAAEWITATSSSKRSLQGSAPSSRANADKKYLTVLRPAEIIQNDSNESDDAISFITCRQTCYQRREVFPRTRLPRWLYVARWSENASKLGKDVIG